MSLKLICASLFLAATLSSAQQVKGFKSEYLDDFAPTHRQLVQLAEAMPAEKYAWRPGPGVRSAGEVYVHIAAGNFLLMHLAGVKLPAEWYPAPPANPNDLVALNAELEKAVKTKAEIVRMLKASLDGVKEQFSKLTDADLERPADFFGEKTTVRRIYLRILAHCSEHMGQSVAYARTNGIKPPWSR